MNYVILLNLFSAIAMIIIIIYQWYVISGLKAQREFDKGVISRCLEDLPE